MSIRGAWILALGGTLLLAGCERPPIETVQQGYRGMGMVAVSNPRLASATMQPQLPAVSPLSDDDGPKARDTFSNVPVLGNLSVQNFTRLMTAITAWVSPEQGCTYCHSADLAADDVYPKVVARRMLQMTRHINDNWRDHVGDTGVTCFTCHRGQPLPAQVWTESPGRRQAGGLAIGRDGQNAPAESVGLTSLPYDPFALLTSSAGGIRVASNQALPSGNRSSILQTETTYALMMHISQALGVNCTHCHNTRAFAPWPGSSPNRVQAWHGLAMVRELNSAFLSPLRDVLPASTLGPLGDAPKAHCGTCHHGLPKPLGGVSQIAEFPSLGGGS